MIYLIYGANGVGKKTVCDTIIQNFGINVISKYTSDINPNLELVDQIKVDEYENFRLNRDKYLIYLSPEVFSAKQGIKESDYVYEKTKKEKKQTYKVTYLIKKEDITMALTSQKDYLLVCSDEKTLNRITSSFNSDLNFFRQILILGKSESTSRKPVLIKGNSINRQRPFWGVIYNRYETDCKLRKDFIIEQWAFMTGMRPLNEKIFFIKPFEEHRKFTQNSSANILYESENIKYNSREDFVYSEINRILRELSESLNLKSILQAEIVSNDLEKQNKNIITNIMAGIKNAGLVIVDLSDNHANCYYELALARAFNKRTIVIFENKELYLKEFDELGFNHFSYSFESKDNNFSNAGTTKTTIVKSLKFDSPPKGQKCFKDLIKEFLYLINNRDSIVWQEKN